MKASEALEASKKNKTPIDITKDLKRALRAIRRVSRSNKPNNTELIFRFRLWQQRERFERGKLLTIELKKLGYYVHNFHGERLYICWNKTSIEYANDNYSSSESC